MSDLSALPPSCLLVLAILCTSSAAPRLAGWRLVAQAALLVPVAFSRAVSPLHLCVTALLLGEIVLLIPRHREPVDRDARSAPAWPAVFGLFAAWLAFRIAPGAGVGAAALGIVFCAVLALLAAGTERGRSEGLLLGGHGAILLGLSQLSWSIAVMLTVLQGAFLVLFKRRPVLVDRA